MDAAALYFIEAPELNLIKIGSSRNPKKRLRYMISHSPCPDLRLLQVLDGQAHLESSVHAMWAKCRSHGEWFKGTESLREWIATGCPMQFQAQPKVIDGATLAKRIRQAREAAGLSQVEAATRAWGDYRRQADWSQYETDGSQPSIPTLRRIAEVLGVSVSQLID